MAVCQRAFLLVLLFLGTYWREVLSESLPLAPESLKISANSTHQRLDLQWQVRSHFQQQELQMIFQIQISRIVTSNVIWVGNYSAIVKGTQDLHWSWESELPLECASHFVRIRSVVGDVKIPGSRSWSNWTSWEKDNVKASLGNGHFFMFPQDKVVEEGSNVTLCYISKSSQDNIYCYLEGEPIQEEQLTPDVSTFTLSRVLFVRSTGTNVFCKLKQGMGAVGTVIYVSKVLDEPKDFLCYIWDLKTLKCTWDPGNDTGLSQTSPTYTLVEASSQKKKLCKHKNWCKWKVTEKSKELYNFTLVAKNSLRKRSINSVFHLTYPDFSESLKLTPKSLKVSNNFSQQRLDLQWHVNSSLYHQKIQMIFQIQISRIVTSNVIWVGNYSASVKGSKVLHWSWESELPLECATHFVRIRSLVDDAKFPKSSPWSLWSPWEKDSVKPNLGEGYFFIFPKYKIVEEGSNVTFCSISRSNQDNFPCYWENNPMRRKQLTPDVSTYTLHQVPYIRPTGGTLYCETKPGDDPEGSVLFVSRILEEPKNFSCETRDLKNLVCTWNPGRDTGLLDIVPIYTLFEEFSQKRKICEHSNRCTWQVTENSQKQYNFTLVAENIFRKRSANSVFHLAHQVHPMTPFDLFLENISSTSATITWKMRPIGINSTFLCQVQLHHDRQVIQQNNVSMKEIGKCLLTGMQPDTLYLVQVHCADGNYFWKWSEWSTKKFTTLEAAPSVGPDVWRLVTSEPDGYKLKLFWKPLSKFHANGKILFYNITVKSLSEPSRLQLHSVPVLITHKELTLPQQHPYQICLTANNSVGSSPPSVIVIPSSPGHEEIGEKRVIGTEDGIALSWRPHSGNATGYVVEWCDRPREPPCGLQWWTLGPNTTSVIIGSDTFTPGLRYNFRIYEISTSYTASLIEKKTGYSQELAPSDNPLVRINSLTSHSFSMSWEDHSTESQPGFIKGYYVYLKTKMDQCSPGFKRTAGAGDSAFCKHKIDNPEQKSFVVDRLQPESFYEFLVTQYTSVGEGPNSTFTKVTTPDEHARKLLRIVLPTFFCVLLVVITCYLKIQWMKKKCYPDIPDPYKSHVLSIINLKETPHLTIMNINECRIDPLEVVNKLEGSKTHSSHAKRSPTKTEPTLSGDYLSLISTEKNPSNPRGSFSFKNSSDRRHRICFDNKTYNWKISDLDSYDQISESPITTLSQRGQLKASESIVKVDEGYVNSLGGITAGEAGLHYVSQLASHLPSDKDRLPGDTPVPAPCTMYQMQMAVPTTPASSPVSEGSNRSSVALLDQCVHYG